jgi:hypothetical protein
LRAGGAIIKGFQGNVALEGRTLGEMLLAESAPFCAMHMQAKVRPHIEHRAFIIQYGIGTTAIENQFVHS